MKKKNCSITNCRNYYITYPNVTFHSFPSNPLLRKLWLRKIDCPDLSCLNDTQIKNHVVCSEHFDLHQFRTSDKKKLNYNACPRIFFISDPRSRFFKKSEPADINEIIIALPEELKDSNTVLHITPIQAIEEGVATIQYKIDTFNVPPDSDIDLKEETGIEEIELNKSVEVIEMINKSDWNNEEVPIIDLNTLEPTILLSHASNPQKQDDDDDEATIDINAICRLCLSDKNLQPLFLSGNSKYYYVQKLQNFTPLQISEKDRLPKKICHACSLKIDNVFNFVRKCTASDGLLREKLGLIIYDHDYPKNSAESAETDDIKSEIKVETMSTTEEDAFHAHEIDEMFTLDEKTGDLKALSPRNDNKTTSETSMDSFEVMENELPTKKKKIVMKHVCRNCLMRFQSISELEAHKNLNESCAQTMSYQCKVCNDLFLTYTELHEHRTKLRHTKPKNKKTCNVCFKTVNNRLSLHMRTHTKEFPYCCEICGMLFKISGNLKRHVMTIHNHEKKFKCDVCNKLYSAKHSLTEHMYIHTGERPYVCSHCGKSYAQQGSLNLHLRSHQKSVKHDVAETEDLNQLADGSYQCSTCGQIFKRRGALQYHITSHADRKHKCEECGRMFLTLQSMHQHYQIHIKDKPFPCEFCDKRFSFSSALKIHLVTHTGERPFKCPLCEMSFTQRSHVTTHMRTHDGERPYACHVCGKRFALNGNLTVHMRIHTGEQPFRCEICGRGFYDSSSMKKHLRAHINAQNSVTFVDSS